MEYLRWILLLAGIVFIAVVYLMNRRRRRTDDDLAVDPDNEIPDFSATDNLDNVDEGVGKVRIIASMEDAEQLSQPDNYALDEVAADSEAESCQVSNDDMLPAAEPVQLIMLYILADVDEAFGGDQINSAARASGMVFGEMSIFHRHDASNRILYSMANMMEPGSFDPDTLHDIETKGLAVFMQPELVDEPVQALDDMLHTAYQLCEMLGGRLCNQKREPLSEADTQHYRQQIDAMASLS